jgi:Protein of unknown function (DUF2637)
MTDLTARPVEPGASGLAPTPVNGAAVADIRTLRQVTRAEQERLSADAQVERRARAARLELELREQRREADRREREAHSRQRQARTEQRRGRRAARRARLRAAIPRWAERALFVLPIMFPMAVAWVGQIRFAMTVMGWPLAAAIVFAAGFELSTAYVARLDWLSRAAGDSALLFRGATWCMAAGAATMNYWHASGPHFAPNGEAVSYGLMSVTGVVLWELLSIYRHRTALRVEGKLPAARPRFGLARWISFRPLTRLAWLLAIRDGYATTDLAWRAALAAVGQYGSAKKARKAVRAGRPVPMDNTDDETEDHRDAEDSEEQRDTETRHEDGGTRAPTRERENPAPGDGPGHDDRDYAAQDTAQHQQSGSAPQTGDRPNSGSDSLTVRSEVPVCSSTALPNDLSTDQFDCAPSDRDEADAIVAAAGPDRDGDRDTAQRGQTAAGGHDRVAVGADDPHATRNGPGVRRRSGKQAVSARMLAYAQERRAQGTEVTGAELDRQFGTRDYGRKVLRRLASEFQAVGV